MQTVFRNKIKTLLINGGVWGGRQGESKRQDIFITVQNGLNLTISHSELNIRRTKAMNTYSADSGLRPVNRFNQ